MSKVLCIYHANCADGFTAAWAVWKALGDDVEFYPGVHQNPPPDVTGRDVVLVDFSYKRDVLLEMGAKARTLLVLDHHESAEKDLADFGYDLANDVDSYAGWVEDVIPYLRSVELAPCGRLFDMKRSGAGIAWDFFHDAPRPMLVDYVEDRDLWRFGLSGSRKINAFVFAHEYTFENWDGLAHLLEYEDTRRIAENGGEAIELKHHKDVAELLAVTRRRMIIGGHDVPVANMPYTLTSDAGHAMAEGEPFAACYWDTPEGRVFSLRSHDSGLNVQEIAALYGGGGHARAASFRVSIGWEGDSE